MSAKIGTVTLPYGVQEEGHTYSELVVAMPIPMASPVLQVLGRNSTPVSIKTTVTKTVYDSLVTQQLGSPMVTFNAGGDSDTDYGLIIQSIAKSRNSKTPDCYALTINAFKLDYAVENIAYDLSDGDFNLNAGSQLMTDETDETVDDYMVRLVVTSTEECSFYVQTSPTGSSWTTYPDTIGWVLDKELRVIDVSHLTGYLRVVADNQGSAQSTINIKLYLSKQE